MKSMMNKYKMTQRNKINNKNVLLRNEK